MMAESRKPIHKDRMLKDFQGINTQLPRTDIEDDEFAWLENAMPIGPGRLQTLAGPFDTSVNLGTDVCYWMCDANINNQDYVFMFCTNGCLYSVTVPGYVKTKIAPNGTFSGSKTRAAQWKNERLLIIDANGYYSWDGTLFSAITGGVTSVAVTAGGNYAGAAAPTVTFTGGGGTGAAATAYLSFGVITLNAAGGGYSVNDVLTFSGGVFVTPIKLYVLTIGGGGAIATFQVVQNGQYTTAPASPVSVTGGTGTLATFNATFPVTSVVVTAAGSGYIAAPAVAFGSGAATATATISGAAVPTAGTTIETYAGRVWIGNNRTVVFSAPNSYLDFTTASYGGSFIITDSTLHSNITQMKSAFGYLYITGTDSVNVVSNVAVSGSPATTTFSNLNIVTVVGTGNPDSVVPFYRTFWLFPPFGFYGITGTTPEKGSDKIDGTVNLIQSSQLISGGIAIINNILCLVYLVLYADPVAGNRSLLLCFYKGKWFAASQGTSLTFGCSCSPATGAAFFATDGTHLYKCFGDATVAVAWTIKSKLWDMENPLQMKQATKLGFDVVPNVSIGSVTVSVDSDTGVSQPYTKAITAGSQIVTLVPNDASNYGRFLGGTITATSTPTQITGVYLQHDTDGATWQPANQ